MDITAWLRELGLERYAEAFRANEIDAAILPKLTSEDLREIGVAAIGHRRKLLEAIASLPDVDQRPSPPPQKKELPAGAVSDARSTGAERRQLTVMFCDLVGSTELSARLDPEDLREVIGAYQASVAEVVRRWDGHVAKYMGDGVLAYFGWPRAHEDDAERAVRAGLELSSAVGRLPAGAEAHLAARIGIATGGVVVGDLIGEGAAQEEAVVGETPNLAARLQALAEPNGVVIGPRTRRLIGGLFDLAELGVRHLKGVAGPVQAWRVVGEGRAEGRFEALHGQRLTPLVGREEELALLLRRWEHARDGEGQIVLLSGEPGIGKSRLTRALQQQLRDGTYTRLLHFCSPYYQNSALYPIIDHLQRAAQLARDDKEEQKLDKLEQLLAKSTTNLQSEMPLFASLLSIPTGERYPPLDLTPEEQKARIFEALVAHVEVLAQQEPVLQVFEDAHWIDPTSLELLELLIERTRTAAVLRIITFRPEFKPPWAAQPHVTFLTLNHLSRKQGAALVERVTAGKTLPPEVREQIVAKTDGVPLFVEELTKTVLESGLLREKGDHYMLLGPLPPLAIPATLHDSLTARLDRLVPVKEVAQIGAAIGREFSYELLALVAPLRPNELHEMLARLEDSELVFRRGTPPQATFTFKHALVQDAAYDSMLRSKRQQIHAAIARCLEAHFAETAKIQPEVLAHHYSEAGLGELAIGYWLKAGQRATEHSANVEAISHLTKGLELLGGLPDTPERTEQELMLQISLAIPFTAVKGYAAPETARAYTRARELCNILGETTQLFPAMYGEWVYHMVKAHQDDAWRVAQEFLRLAEQHQAPAGIVVAHRTLGLSLLNLGQLAAGREQMEQVVRLYEPEAHRSLAFHYGQDPRAVALSFLAWIEWFLGYPDRALKHCHEAIDLARDLSHATTTAYALSTAPYVHCFCGDLRGAHEVAQAAVGFSMEQRNPFWLAMARVIWGWVLAEEGQVELGLAEIRSGLDEWRATDSAWLWPCYLAVLAQALTKANQTEQALETVDEALATVTATNESFYESELHRLRAEFLLHLSLQQNHARAEAEWLQALEITQNQGARSLELRTATSLARLWRDQGRRTEAHDLLAPVYGWFTEGFDTKDLKEAKALLDDLR